MEEMEKSHRSQGTAGRLSVPRVPLPGEKRQQILLLLLFQQKQQKLQGMLQQKQQKQQPYLRVLGWLH